MKKVRGVAYLLFGPGQLVLQLLLLFEKSLILSTQRREASSHLSRKLRDILLRLIVHSCVSHKQTLRCGREFCWTATLRLRVKEAALSSEGRIGGIRKRDCQDCLEEEKFSTRHFPRTPGPSLPRCSLGGASGLRLNFWPWLRSFSRDTIFLYSMPSIS